MPNQVQMVSMWQDLYVLQGYKGLSQRIARGIISDTYSLSQLLFPDPSDAYRSSVCDISPSSCSAVSEYGVEALLTCE
jgi:hypothetical protein